MSRPTDVAVVETSFYTLPLPYRAPLKFGGRIVAGGEMLTAVARVRTFNGKEAVGFGSMPLGNVWAWPSNVLEPQTTADAVRRLAQAVAAAAKDLAGYAHPLDHTHALRPTLLSLAKKIAREMELAEPIPPLAVLLAASPIDAALHDAFGKANGINSFNALSAEFVSRDLSHYLDKQFRGDYLDRYTLREPKPRMPLYHLVGALDPLTAGDVAKPIADGGPETLGDWIAADDLTHLKIKLNGDDLQWDVERVTAVEQVAAETQRRLGRQEWFYSLDFNEKCRDVEYVLAFLATVGERAPAALARVQYIEQPTHRDLRAHPENRMHRAAAIKPVVIDESLIDYESLLLAREQGYSGVALKACKGQTDALLMGAAAQKFGMFLCVQDLTCPGASFLHSAALSARLPTIAAIEGNARQYCPSGNDGWREKYPGLFHVVDGELDTSTLIEPGLGFSQL